MTAEWGEVAEEVLVAAFVLCQILYSLTFLVELYFFTRPVNWVRMEDAKKVPEPQFPYVVLFYPVLRELESTMRTTFTALSNIDYPEQKYRVIAIPNSNDAESIAGLMCLQKEFAFVRVVQVPPTSDPSWRIVWENWNKTDKAYWWHRGSRAHNRNLPPKKTRQLIYAFYNVAEELKDLGDFLVNYIDADSCPPRDHFLGAAAGMQHFDALQSQNIAGNLNESIAASWHAFDHMAWDGMKYPHLSANGHHPFWVLGKGLFFWASDLIALGGFHPWIAIEDPEVGMRFWINGKKLGIIKNPLIEEVPKTFLGGITQRKRWVCGFFQSLSSPLAQMGFSPWDKFKAWLNFFPCLSLSINALGTPTGIWVLWSYLDGVSAVPAWMISLCAINLSGFAISMISLYWQTWKRTALVLDSITERLWYMLRVNPLFIMIWWLVWLIPLWMGFRMYLRDRGLVWERTEKINANQQLIETKLSRGEPSHAPAAAVETASSLGE
jgi:cellulose synthase/poly-beta-1,6-N-acetylglucosamine synthase-like glycosyltransferase